MASNEHIKKWFLELKSKLAEQGCDIDTTEGMLMLQTFKKLDPITLVPRYVMMSMDDNLEYVVPDPGIKEDDVKKSNDILNQSKDILNKSESLYKDAQKAFEEDRLEDFSSLAIQAGDEGNKAVQKRMEYHDTLYTAFKEHDRWLIDNLKPIDPDNPDDMDRMKQLYDAAADGTLVRYNGNDSNFTQIYIKKDGGCGITESTDHFDPHNPTLEDCKNPNKNYMFYSPEEWSSMFRTSPELKAAYEREYHVQIPVLPQRPVKPHEPEEVAKPGAFSWFKRILSFGLAHSDFDRYNDYLQTHEAYEQEQVEYLRQRDDYNRTKESIAEQMKLVSERLCENTFPDSATSLATLTSNNRMMKEARSNLLSSLSGRPDIELQTAGLQVQHDAELIQKANREGPGFFSKLDLKDDGYHRNRRLLDVADAYAKNLHEDLKHKYTTRTTAIKVTRDLNILHVNVDVDELECSAMARCQSMIRLFRDFDKDNLSPTDMLNRKLLGDSSYSDPFDEHSAAYAEIAKFGGVGGFDEGMRLLVGMLDIAGQKDFERLINFVAFKDGGLTRFLKPDPVPEGGLTPEQTKRYEAADRLIAMAKEHLSTDGQPDDAKYAECLRSVISKVNFNVISRPGLGLTVSKIAQSALSSKLLDVAEKQGLLETIPDKDKAVCQTAKGIPFVCMASDQGEIVLGALHNFSNASPDKERTQKMEVLSEYGTIGAATVVGHQLKTTYKAGNFSQLIAFSDNKTYLAKLETAKASMASASNEVLNNLQDRTALNDFIKKM